MKSIKSKYHLDSLDLEDLDEDEDPDAAPPPPPPAAPAAAAAAAAATASTSAAGSAIADPKRIKKNASKRTKYDSDSDYIMPSVPLKATLVKERVENNNVSGDLIINMDMD